MASPPLTSDPTTWSVFVDTSVYRHRKFSMDGRVFSALLELVRDGHARLLTTTITNAECRKRIREAVDIAVAKHKKYLAQAWALKRFAEFAPIFAKLEPNQLAARLEGEVDRYMSDAAGEVIDIGKASIEDVVRQYLDGSPPFGPKDKKHEFPDAIVLSALLNWARTTGERVYVISRDEKFRQACREADGLYPLADVSDFLSIIAGHQRVAAARITRAFSDRRDEVASLISEAFGDLRFYLDSDFAEGDAELNQVDAVRIEGEAVTFEIGDNQATVEVTSEVTFSAGVSYDDPGTGVWDSEDHVMLFVQKKRECVPHSSGEGGVPCRVRIN